MKSLNLISKHLVQEFLLIIPIFCVILILIFFIIESSLNYFLFFFGILFLTYIYYTLKKDKITFNLTINPIKIKHFSFSYLLIFFPVFNLFMYFFQADDSFFIGLTSLFIISFIPGYVLVKLFNLRKKFVKLELLLFSYIISFIFTSLFWIALVFFLPNSDIPILIYLLTLSIICLIPIFLKEKEDNSSINEDKELLKITDFEYLGLFLIITFLFLVLFIFVYPNAALNPGDDLAKHYASSLRLNRTPNYLINFNYIFHHAFQASFISISNCNYLNVQLNLLLLNLWLPIAFFLAVKRFFPKNTKIPILSVFFWILLTNAYGGFSWLYFLREKVLSTNSNQLDLLMETNLKTLYSIWYGILGLWYEPLTTGILLLLALIILFKNKALTNKQLAILFLAIFIAQYLTHVVEAIIICLILCLYSFVRMYYYEEDC